MDGTKYKSTLNSKDQQYACEVLHEDPCRLDVFINQCYYWLRTQEDWHLNPKTDPVTIIRFLRGCKYDVEKACRKMKCYYDLRKNSPEWFHNRNPFLPELQELLKLGVFLPLLKKDPEGRTVIIIRATAHNPKIHKQNDVFKIGTMTLDLAISQDETLIVYGVTAIFDLTNVSPGHAAQLSPNLIKKAVHSWQDCYPVRPKSLDFINSPCYVNVVLNIFRRFMNKKMRDRVHVHGYDQSSLHSLVPKEILPEEYGGTDGKLQHVIDYWKEKVSNAHEWFAQEEHFKAKLDANDLE